MRLKITLRRATGNVDLTITADATASVADIARRIADADPTRTSALEGPLTLRAADAFAAANAERLLDGDTGILDSGIRSGSRIELTRSSPGPARQAEQPAAVLRVLSGPDAGREFPLHAGTNVVGRDRGVDVRLTDPLVSKRHARISVTDTVEITDLNSANGVTLSGDLVTRATLTSADAVVLGETSLSVVPLQGSARTQGAVLEHVRSPRVVPKYPGREFPTPKAPTLPAPQRFPLIAMAAPLMLGGVMYVLQPGGLGVVMMMMTPLLLVASWVDHSMTSHRSLRAQKKQFDESMLRLQAKLENERETERRVRLLESPSLAEVERAVELLGPLLWTRRPEHSGFLGVGLGLGRAASRNTVVLPQNNDTLPDCWEQMEELRAAFSVIDDVPIVADLNRDGSIGIAGPRSEVAGVARGLMMQVLGLHSPAEVVVCAVVSPVSRLDWEWLKWVPHTSSAHSPLAGEHLADGPTGASSLFAQVEGLIESRLSGKAPKSRGDVREDEGMDDQPASRVPALLLLIENDAPIDRGRATRLAERGPDVGVHVLWCAPATAQLPAACRTFIELDRTQAGGLVGEVRLGEQVHPVMADALDAPRAEALARLLAPVTDVGSPEDDDSDLPTQVSYAQLAGEEILDSVESVIDRWRENHSLTPRDGSAPVRRRKEGNLRALVGHAGAVPLYLDLRREGPHALVGGTTGAGKSEFLQSWVLGMAAANSPDRLTFLFVDYKGGAAFADCVKLPHTVGLVTDLSPHLVRRALTSLRAELRYREHLLQRKKAKDLISLEKTGDPECPPSLVIIVDEFAALVQEVPEFVDGVVDVAQRGRSLGLHLVLATQRPAGVIKDNLRANTNLRVALRMADTDDSVDILGDPMAAHFDPSTPGRGAVKTGPGRIQTFQTGYAGGWTTNEPPRPRIELSELPFGGGQEWEVPETESMEVGDPGPNDIARIVANVRGAAAAACVPDPRKPWLSELATIYDLRLLPNPRTDERLLLGALDLPESQSQPTAFYEPDRDGNMAIFGTGGSGKSTALRTIAAAAAFTARGGPVHVYGLDFGSRGLKMLEDLPHVGAIIDGDDEERVIRLLRMLRGIVDDRSVRFAAVRAGSISEYRTLAGAPNEPRILLLVDGIGVFRDRYEFGSAEASGWFNAFSQIAADGRPLGVHIVMTGDRPNSIPTSIASTVQRRIVLRLADAEEYLLLGVPKDILEQTSPAGRGILDGNEIQFAILGDSPNIAIQAREIQTLATSMRRSESVPPARVARLPEQVWLADLPVGEGTDLVIGLDDITLGAVHLAAQGPLLLAGPPTSGRTTALSTLSIALARSAPSTRQVFFSSRVSPLSKRTQWQLHAEGASAVAEQATRLADELEARAAGNLALFVEHITDFSGGEAEFALDRLIKAAIREGCFVVGEAETSTWSQAWTLAQPFKAGRNGLLLSPGDMDGDTLLGTPLGRLRRADFPPGRGFLIRAGRARKVQIAAEGM
ncbi:MAG: FtsK/SpoIIIE domain-containing protein [Propionicimonas sp.]